MRGGQVLPALSFSLRRATVSLNLFVTLLLNGLANGMVYALLSMGLILLFRSVGVLNFAQGNMLALGAFLGYAFLVQANMPLWAAIICCLICYALIGLAFMVCIYLPLKDSKYPVAIIVATIGTSTVLNEVISLIWGNEPKPVPYIIKNPETGGGAFIRLGTVTLQWQLVLTVIVGVVLIAMLNILFEKFFLGKMMEASCQDKYAAELIGVPTLITVSVTYVLAIGLGCIGGFMVAPMYSASVALSVLQLRAFASVIIGGTRSIKGSIIGALIVGLIESFATIRFSNYKNAVIFIIIIVFLLIKPDGLVKSKIGDKA